MSSWKLNREEDFRQFWVKAQRVKMTQTENAKFLLQQSSTASSTPSCTATTSLPTTSLKLKSFYGGKSTSLSFNSRNLLSWLRMEFKWLASPFAKDRNGLLGSSLSRHLWCFTCSRTSTSNLTWKQKKSEWLQRSRLWLAARTNFPSKIIILTRHCLWCHKFAAISFLSFLSRYTIFTNKAETSYRSSHYTINQTVWQISWQTYNESVISSSLIRSR